MEKSDSLREYGDRPYEEFLVIIGELTEFLALEGLHATMFEDISVNDIAVHAPC